MGEYSTKATRAGIWKTGKFGLDSAHSKFAYSTRFLKFTHEIRAKGEGVCIYVSD